MCEQGFKSLTSNTAIPFQSPSLRYLHIMDRVASIPFLFNIDCQDTTKSSRRLLEFLTSLLHSLLGYLFVTMFAVSAIKAEKHVYIFSALGKI